MKSIFCLLFLFFTGLAVAQVVIPIQVNGISQSVGCGDAIFTDSGGPAGDYLDNESGIITFCPTGASSLVSLDFTLIDLAPGDELVVYDGDSISAPVITMFDNTTTAAVRVTATGASGCLTFQFTSDNAGVAAGWQANRSCVDTCQTITPQIATVPAIDADGILRVCQGEEVRFNGQTNFSNNGAGATYEWNFDNGGGFVNGQNQTETFNNAGSYQVQFRVTDTDGCTDNEIIDLIIQVATNPDFTGTAATDTEICLGETTTITGAVQSVPFIRTPAPPVTGRTFLPDGTGAVYSTCIDVEGFSPGATISNSSDLISMFMNIEHSWADDLDIILTAPNGSSVTILQTGRSNGEKFLGIPDQSDTPDPPGVGFTYTITETPPAIQSFQNALRDLPSARSLPEGSYFPTTPFSNFIGSSLNGQWCLTVTDNLALDNGYIFQWGLNFDPSLLPADLSFEPTPVRAEWLADSTITNTVGTVITVQPDAAGTSCYIYEYEDSFGCIYQEEVCIQVNSAPVLNNPIDLNFCDNAGTATTIDLTQNIPIVLGAQNASDFDIAFYTNQADALAQTNPIASPAQFVASTTIETIYISVGDPGTNCVTTRDFEVSINSAVFNTASNILLCDDTSNDGIAVFDLTSQQIAILGGQDPATVSISYHRNTNDANTGTNPIANPSNYINEQSPQQTIVVRVESNADATCFDTGSFDLVLGQNPVANPVSDLVVCDDSSNDGVAIFNLGSKDTEVLGSQDPAVFSISYYSSQMDADARQNALDRTSFENTGASQLIIARIESRANTDCYNTTAFNLTVSPSVNIVTPSNLNICDDPSGDGQEIVDLTINNGAILDGADPANFNITYYSNAADAQAGLNALSNSLIVNQSTTPIFVRVDRIGSTCFAIVDFTVNLNLVPQTFTVSALQACDQDNDGMTVFNLNDQIDAIINGQSGIDITFYESESNAITGTSSLNAANYSTSASSAIIFYRSQFTATGCFTTDSFLIESTTSPIAGIPSTVLICDAGDGSATYNLTNSDAQIINGQLNASVTYFESEADAIANTNPLATTYNFNQNTTLYARLENGFASCFDIVPLQLEYGEVPVPQLMDQIILCRNNEGVLTDGPAVLDTGLNDVNFDFEWSRDGQLVVGETGPILITEQAGNYTVRVTNTTTGCTIEDAVNVRFSGPPDTFTVDVTSQPFDLNHRIEVTAQGLDTYWFQLDDGLFQDSPIFENVPPGVHTLTIAERSGCGSIATTVFVFGYPLFFTPNFDGFNDTWNIAAGDRLPVLKIYIFDRFGKLLKELQPTGPGWDGTYLGELMPSSDYWFRLEYEFEGVLRETTGHFSLKR